MTQNEAFDLLKIFGKIGSVVSFLPLILSIWKWKYFKEKPLFWLFLYFLSGVILNWFTSAFVELATKYWSVVGPTLQKWKIDDTFFIDPIYFLRNAVFLGLFCSESIKDQRYSSLIKKVSISFVLIIILNTILGEGYEEYQSIGNTLDNLFKVFISSLVFKSIFTSSNKRSLTKIPHFWVASSIMLIGSCAGLIDLLSNQLIEQNSVLFYKAHVLKDCFVIAAFLSYSIGIYYLPWKKQI